MAADEAKTEDQKTKVMKAEAGASGHPHTGWVKTLVVVATLLTIIACFAVWVQRQALETNEWVKTSGKLLQNPDIRDALANYSVDQLYANVNVEGYIKPLLPKDIQAAAGPASTGLRQLAVDGAQKVLATDRFQQLWENANRAAHERLIAIIENKSNVISTGGGEVTLKLRPLITQVADQLGLPGDLSQKIPPDVGNLHIFSSNDLSLAQTIAKVIRGLALVLTLLALGLFALAIYLSRGYRWVTVLGTGMGLIIAGAVVLILRSVAGNIVVDALAADVARPAADAAWSIGTSLLSSIAKTVIVYGVFFLVAAWLASPHKSSALRPQVAGPLPPRLPAGDRGDDRRHRADLGPPRPRQHPGAADPADPAGDAGLRHLRAAQADDRGIPRGEDGGHAGSCQGAGRGALGAAQPPGPRRAGARTRGPAPGAPREARRPA